MGVECSGIVGSEMRITSRVLRTELGRVVWSRCFFELRLSGVENGLAMSVSSALVICERHGQQKSYLPSRTLFLKFSIVQMR